ncbi:MAG: 16S rRNA (adenine(1518)-N(6)/adenine(1519)-N(6))-dimethyltransferase RsmA [Clostridia bacterium]|nr:16S rRNA (adenine(1518)-N(6)/adenine(1519)-N(6))-dimethyltransferase RsmA [Clostridia bacterium]
MNLYDETRMLLNQYGLKAKKKFGQNFLINQDIIDSIIEKSEITQNDVVLEIGPGLGTLTKELLKHSKRVIAVELDEDMCNILKNRFDNGNLEVICDDILKIDLNEFTNKYGSIKVVANLPYYITTPIIMKLLESEYKIDSITVMVQKEVGDRICSTSKDRENSSITIGINYYAKPKIIIDVPKENFFPSPEVDSCVIKLDVLEKPPVNVKDKDKFFNIVKMAFSQRRKTILNSLSSSNYSKEQVANVLEKLNLDSKLRAEDLSIEDYANISNEI